MAPDRFSERDPRLDARLYAAHAHHLRSRRRALTVVTAGNAVVGAAAAGIGAATGQTVLLVFGTAFVLFAGIFAVVARARLTERLLMLRVRITRLTPPGADTDATIELEVLERRRLRPDGRSRIDAPRRRHDTLSTLEEVAGELSARHAEWGDIALLATSDELVIATLDRAMLRATTDRR